MPWRGLHPNTRNALFRGRSRVLRSRWSQNLKPNSWRPDHANRCTSTKEKQHPSTGSVKRNNLKASIAAGRSRRVPRAPKPSSLCTRVRTLYMHGRRGLIRSKRRGENFFFSRVRLRASSLLCGPLEGEWRRATDLIVRRVVRLDARFIRSGCWGSGFSLQDSDLRMTLCRSGPVIGVYNQSGKSNMRVEVCDSCCRSHCKPVGEAGRGEWGKQCSPAVRSMRIMPKEHWPLRGATHTWGIGGLKQTKRNGGGSMQCKVQVEI